MASCLNSIYCIQHGHVYLLTACIRPFTFIHFCQAVISHVRSETKGEFTKIRPSRKNQPIDFPKMYVHYVLIRLVVGPGSKNCLHVSRRQNTTFSYPKIENIRALRLALSRHFQLFLIILRYEFSFTSCVFTTR